LLPGGKRYQFVEFYLHVALLIPPNQQFLAKSASSGMDAASRACASIVQKGKVTNSQLNDPGRHNTRPPRVRSRSTTRALTAPKLNGNVVGSGRGQASRIVANPSTTMLF
jgi:hypothetical protein